MICLKCGRKLKSIASMDAGYGPVCYKRLFGISLRTIKKGSNVQETANIPYHALQGQVALEEYLRTVLD